MGVSRDIIKMKILAGIAALLPFTFGCSTNGCSCSYGFYRANGPDGYFCYRKSTSKATYLNAKEICSSINATFPIVNSDEDLEFYTDVQKKANGFKLNIVAFGVRNDGRLGLVEI